MENNNRKYYKLTGKSNQKFASVNDNQFFTTDTIALGNHKIEIKFFVNKFGKIISPIFNSYFVKPDDAKMVKEMGYVAYKKDLLNRIIDDLLARRTLNNENISR